MRSDESGKESQPVAARKNERVWNSVSGSGRQTLSTRSIHSGEPRGLANSVDTQDKRGNSR